MTKSNMRKAAILAFLLCIFIGNPAHAATSWDITHLLHSGANETNVVFAGTRLYYAKDADIWVHDLANNTDTPILERPDYQVPTGGIDSLVVYQEYEGPTDGYDIKLYNPATHEDTTIAGGIGSQTGGKTDGTWVVYLNGYGTGDLYAYNINTHMSTFIAHDADVPQIHNGKVVWGFNNGHGGSNIGGYNLNTNTAIPLPNDPSMNLVHPQISDEYAIWDQGLPQTDIYAKNLSTGVVTQLTNTPIDESWPSLDGALVAWTSEDAPDRQSIWTQDLSSSEPAQTIFSDTNTNQGPNITTVNGNQVAWEWPINNGDIYLAERIDITALLQQMRTLAQQAGKQKILKGNEVKSIAQPAKVALNDFEQYNEQMERHHLEKAHRWLTRYYQQLDGLLENITTIGQTSGRETVVAQLQGLLIKIRNNSPSL